MEGFLKNEVHLSRGNIYLFLKNCLSDIPSVAFYEMIENMLHQLENIVQGSDNIDMQEGYQGMLDFITERNKLSSNELDELDLYISREYTSCLCIPGIAPQEESYYISEEHILKQESNDDMIKLFYRYGFALSENIQADYDNVCIELTFISRLAYMSADTTDEEEYKNLMLEQLNFHINHFDKWIYQFYNKIIEQKVIVSKLYKYIAMFSKGFIQEDKLLLQDLREHSNI